MKIIIPVGELKDGATVSKLHGENHYKVQRMITMYDI